MLSHPASRRMPSHPLEIQKSQMRFDNFVKLDGNPPLTTAIVVSHICKIPDTGGCYDHTRRVLLRIQNNTYSVVSAQSAIRDHLLGVINPIIAVRTGPEICRIVPGRNLTLDQGTSPSENPVSQAAIGNVWLENPRAPALISKAWSLAQQGNCDEPDATIRELSEVLGHHSLFDNRAGDTPKQKLVRNDIVTIIDASQRCHMFANMDQRAR
jgi:hypothetical protein